jgi:phosphoserine phosphatase
MNTITIAFDVDGTLIRNDMKDGKPVANERIRSLLVTLASFKNVKIVVWSGGGELYARQIASAIGIEKYVDQYAGKNHVATTKTMPPVHIFKPDIKPDIAIDDIQGCELGIINLIVREK